MLANTATDRSTPLRLSHVDGVRAISVLVHEAREASAILTVPAGCVAQAWRRPAKQARLAGFLRLPNVTIVALDDEHARLVGLLLAHSRTRDIVDAHVAILGARLQQCVLTSDPDDLTALVPTLRVHCV
jgi:hypothetical protein